MSIGKAKTVIEVMLCLLAWLAGGPIGVTTVVTAVVFGAILQWMLGRISWES